MTNINELKNISRLALIKEIIEKTENSALIWNEIAPGKYKSTQGVYDFYVGRSSPSIYNLDVLKNGTFYRTYNSSTLEGIDELALTIESIVSSTGLSKYQKIGSFLTQIRTCRTGANSESLSGGLVASGEVEATQTQNTSSLLLPTSLSFEPSPFPWTGTYHSIDDSPSVNFHDGDSTYIRQTISGPAPTNWGYVAVGFNLNGIPQIPPFTYRVRVAGRREEETGVTVRLDVMINSAIVFTTTLTPLETYGIYSTGLQSLSDSSIDEVEVRLSMITNSGNHVPRSVRITAVDMLINGSTAVE